MQLYTTVITATSIITNWNNSEYVAMLSPPFVRMGANRLPFLEAPENKITNYVNKINHMIEERYEN